MKDFLLFCFVCHCKQILCYLWIRLDVLKCFAVVIKGKLVVYEPWCWEYIGHPGGEGGGGSLSTWLATSHVHRKHQKGVFFQINYMLSMFFFKNYCFHFLLHYRDATWQPRILTFIIIRVVEKEHKVILLFICLKDIKTCISCTLLSTLLPSWHVLAPNFL